jgi:hypothetical protein
VVDSTKNGVGSVPCCNKELTISLWLAALLPLGSFENYGY